MTAPRSYCAVVVDDHYDTAESLARLLVLMGCQASFVTDARAVVAEVLVKKPHIVFLDIRMPIINGYELAEMIRKSRSQEETKLVALTGQPVDQARSRKAGFDAHVMKPADPALVESILKTLLPP